MALHVVQNCQCVIGAIAQWAKAFGAKHVFAIDLDEKKVEIAKSMGLVDLRKKDDIDAIVKEKTNGTGIDRAFEAFYLQSAY